jgi:hypothetical protein
LPAGPNRTVATEPTGPALGLTDRLGVTVAEAIEGVPTTTAAAVKTEHITMADPRHQSRLPDRIFITILLPTTHEELAPTATETQRHASCDQLLPWLSRKINSPG